MTNSKRTGPVGYTGFVHPAARINTKQFSIGGASLIEPFVSLDGESAKIGVACNQIGRASCRERVYSSV